MSIQSVQLHSYDQISDDDFIFDATYLNPYFHLTQSEPEPNIASIHSLYGRDVGFFLDTINWMAMRDLVDVFTIEENGLDFLELTFDIDSFQINTGFDDVSEENIEEIITNATYVLMNLGWTIVDYNLEKVSDNENYSIEKIRELGGEDPVEYIEFILRYQIPNTVSRTLND